jgi:8-oxo-dGTP diphosphatase
VWLSPTKAMKLTTYERDRQVIIRGMQILTEPTSTRIYLVRHAMAGRRSLWPGLDHARPLSGVGRRQTVAITYRLLERPVTRVLTSDFLRCDQTVRPLAGAIALRVRHHPALAEGADPGEAFELMRTLPIHSAVLCSHGDIISGVIEKLAADGVELGDTLEWKKGSVWELELVKGQVISGRYRPPP